MLLVFPTFGILVIINKNKLEVVWCHGILAIPAFHVVLSKALLVRSMIDVWGWCIH